MNDNIDSLVITIIIAVCVGAAAALLMWYRSHRRKKIRTQLLPALEYTKEKHHPLTASQIAELGWMEENDVKRGMSSILNDPLNSLEIEVHHATEEGGEDTYELIRDMKKGKEEDS